MRERPVPNQVLGRPEPGLVLGSLVLGSRLRRPRVGPVPFRSGRRRSRPCRRPRAESACHRPRAEPACHRARAEPACRSYRRCSARPVRSARWAFRQWCCGPITRPRPSWPSRNRPASCRGGCWPVSGTPSRATPRTAASLPTALPAARSWGRGSTAASPVTRSSATPTTAHTTATPAMTAPSGRCSSSPRPGSAGARTATPTASATRATSSTPRWPPGTTCARTAVTCPPPPVCRRPSSATTTRRRT